MNAEHNPKQEDFVYMSKLVNEVSDMLIGRKAHVKTDAVFMWPLVFERGLKIYSGDSVKLFN